MDFSGVPPLSGPQRQNPNALMQMLIRTGQGMNLTPPPPAPTDPQQQGQQSTGLGQTAFAGIGNMLGFGQQQPGAGMPMNILPPIAQGNPNQDLGAPAQQPQGKAGIGQAGMQALMKMFMGA